MIRLKRADSTDIKNVYENSNDEEVRKVSLSSGTIPWEEHVKWYEKIINDLQTFFYVAYDEDRFAGQIRFTLNGNNSVISISIDRNIRGKGFGNIILNLSIENFKKDSPETEEITAFIKEENIASVRLFEKNGFLFTGREVLKGNTVLKYSKKLR